MLPTCLRTAASLTSLMSTRGRRDIVNQMASHLDDPLEASQGRLFARLQLDVRQALAFDQQIMSWGESLSAGFQNDNAPDMARAQGVRSLDLRAAGIVDRIVAERPDAADEPEEFCRRLGEVLRYELATLLHRDRATLVDERARRYRDLGVR